MKVPLENEGGIGRGIKPKRDRKRIYFIDLPLINQPLLIDVLRLLMFQKYINPPKF